MQHTLFILGDHGFPPAKKNDLLQRSLFDDNLNVPLLIWSDGLIKKPMIIEETASQIDLFPTVMDIMNWKGRNHAMGTSLVRKASRTAFFQVKDFSLTGCAEEDFKLINDTSLESLQLYDRREDSNEKTNLFRKRPEKALELKKKTEQVFDMMDKLYQSHRIAPESKSEYYCKISDKNDFLNLKKKKPIHLHVSCNLSKKEWKALSFEQLHTLAFEGIEKSLNLQYGLKKAKNLKELSFFQSSWNDFLFTNTSSGLIKLSLKNCGWIELHSISRFTQLEDLVLSGSLFDCDELKHILKNCRRLKTLILNECLTLRVEFFHSLTKYENSLQELSLENIPLEDDFFLGFKKEYPYMKKINLNGSNSLSPIACLNLLQNFPNLFTLSLNISGWSDEDLFNVFEPCKNIRSLFLHCCNLSDQGILTLVEKLKQLQNLEIHEAPALTPALLQKLSDSTQVGFFFMNCPKIHPLRDQRYSLISRSFE